MRYSGEHPREWVGTNLEPKHDFSRRCHRHKINCQWAKIHQGRRAINYPVAHLESIYNWFEGKWIFGKLKGVYFLLITYCTSSHPKCSPAVDSKFCSSWAPKSQNCYTQQNYPFHVFAYLNLEFENICYFTFLYCK